MNPTALTDRQLNQRPILLLHGNYHNQSAWLGLAKELRRCDLGPVYTVNLPNGDITDRDYVLIQEKIDQIKAQYGRSVKVDLVGHSRGGYLAGRMAWTLLREDLDQIEERKYRRPTFSEDIGVVIKIGDVFTAGVIQHVQEIDSNFSNRICEITGKYDVLETDLSLLPPEQNEVVGAGHLGLLSSPQTHRRVIRELSRQ